MNEIIHDVKEYSRMVTIQRGKDWFMLKFDCTEYLDKVNGDIALEAFELAVNEIRNGLKKSYGKD